eukprot:762573_1
MERFRYGEAMDYDDENGNTMQIHKVGNVQFLKVIEFIFDHDKNHKNHKKQCYLEFKDVENQILLFVKKTRGYLRDEGQWLSFEKDEEWDVVNVIYNGIRQDTVQRMKKCVTYLEYKVCVVQIMMKTRWEHDEYRVIVMKLHNRVEDDVPQERDQYSPQYYDF